MRLVRPIAHQLSWVVQCKSGHLLPEPGVAMAQPDLLGSAIRHCHPERKECPAAESAPSGHTLCTCRQCAFLQSGMQVSCRKPTSSSKAQWRSMLLHRYLHMPSANIEPQHVFRAQHVSGTQHVIGSCMLQEERLASRASSQSALSTSPRKLNAFEVRKLIDELAHP